MTLVLTAVALLSLARVGTSIGRETAYLREPAAPVPQPDLRRQRTSASSKRAA